MTIRKSLTRMAPYKTYAVLLAGFCLCSPILNAQTKNVKHPLTAAGTAKSAKDSAPVLLPVEVSGKWGYVNSTGQLVINPQFDLAREFHEGRAAVCVGKPCDWLESPGDSRWGYIDTSGKLIVAPQYASVSSFSEGLASVCTGDRSGPATRGYIDREGKLVIPMQFGTAHDFEEGLALVCIGKCDWAIDGGYNGKFGFIDHSGHFVINPQYDDAGDFKNGVAKVAVGRGYDPKTGYIDKTGKIIWQPSN